MANNQALKTYSALTGAWHSLVSKAQSLPGSGYKRPFNIERAKKREN